MEIPSRAVLSVVGSVPFFKSIKSIKKSRVVPETIGTGMLSFPQCCGTSVTKHQLRRSYKANRFISHQDAKEHSDSYRDAKFS